MNKFLRKVIAAVTAVAIGTSMLTVVGSAEFAKGGEHRGYTAVSDFKQFTVAMQDPKAKVVLTDNIEIDYVLLGNDPLCANNFEGVLDGNGFAITNLQHPLFTRLGNATFKNLSVYANFTDESNVFCHDVNEGVTDLSFENVYVSADCKNSW